MVAVTEKKHILEFPEDLSRLRGGTFDGMDQYLKLVRACCEYEPSMRPSTEDVIGELRTLLEIAAIGKGQKPPARPGKLLRMLSYWPLLSFRARAPTGD
jgi:hypothetical protein